MPVSSPQFIGQDPSPELFAHDQKQMRPIYAENFQPWFPSDRSAAWLDYGCGYGTFLHYLHGEGFRNLRGFDPDQRCVDFSNSLGKAKVEGGIPPLEYLSCQSGLQMITLLNVLNYVKREEMEQLFALLFKALEPGGRVLVDVPNGAGVSGFTDYIQDPYMKSVYTDILLGQLAERAGLKVEHLGSLRFPAKGLKRAIWLLGQGIWHRILRMIYLLERGNSERNPRHFGVRLIMVARRPE